MTDIRQTPSYARFLKSVDWEVYCIHDTYYYCKKIPLIGMFFVKIQHPNKIRENDIIRFIEKYANTHTIIEPANNSQINQLKPLGFKQSNNPYLPTKTLILDISSPENILLSNFKNDARKSILQNQKAKIKRLAEKDITTFRKSWKKTTGIFKYVPKTKTLVLLKKAFGINSLFVSDQNLSSGAVFLKSDNTIHYWYAFTNHNARKSHLQYRLIWEGILWGKGKGANYLDFEGVFDERFPNKSWLGFTHFKESFCGKEKYYPGAFSKVNIRALSR